jgi:hypothetical protein
MAKKPAHDLDKFVLRLPDGMRERIAAEAKANARSMTHEIILGLEGSMDEVWESAARLERIEAAVTEINRKIGEGHER